MKKLIWVSLFLVCFVAIFLNFASFAEESQEIDRSKEWPLLEIVDEFPDDAYRIIIDTENEEVIYTISHEEFAEMPKEEIKDLLDLIELCEFLKTEDFKRVCKKFLPKWVTEREDIELVVKEDDVFEISRQENWALFTHIQGDSFLMTEVDMRLRIEELDWIESPKGSKIYFEEVNKE